MNPLLKEIYGLVIPAAPYVVGAYGIIWVALFGYVFAIANRVGRLEKEIDVVEAAVKRRAE